MIPLQLRLRNFLSYGATTQTINFEPYRLICLTGKNGHGKSALLDALTWALWGQARKVAGITRSDDLLVRLGQSHMMVSLDFLCNNEHYRVTRELTFITNKKPQQELQFGVLNKSTNCFTALTEKTIRATQERIIAILGLDYEACTNSIFLRQGQSDEFSKRAPKERKEILAAMLGLDRFETLRSYAVEHYRAGNREVDLVRIQSQTLEQECAQELQLTHHAQDLALALATLTTREQDCKNILIQREQERTQKLEQLSELRVLQNSLEQTAFAQQKKELELKALIASWRSAHRNKRHAATFKQNQLLAEDLEKKIEKLEQLQTQYLTDKEQFFTYSSHISQLREKAQAAFIKEQTILLQHVTDSEKKVRDLTEQIHKINQHSILLSQEITKKTTLRSSGEHELDSCKKQLSHEPDRAHTLQKNTDIQQQWLSRLATKKQLFDDIQTQQNHLQNLLSTCPLCSQPLAQELKETLELQLVEKAHLLSHQIRRLKHLTKILAEENRKKESQQKERIQKQAHSAALESRLAAIEQELLFLQQELSAQNAALQTAQNTHEQALCQHTQARKELEAFTAQQQYTLENHPEIKTLEQLRAALQEKLDATIYDSEEIKSLKEKRTKLREQQEVLRVLSDDITRQTDRREQIKTISSELKDKKNIQKNVYECRKKIALITEELQYNETECRALKETLTTYAEQKLPLVQEQGALEQQLKQITEKREILVQYQKKLARFEQLLDDYQLLASALGKNGIQALLIENTIPEIEHEANVLLSKLTDNQAHVMFESVRDLKSGGTKETLDIKISDTMGIRPYELFSGGEAFRIDFALRIAISKFLARRSGTSLQTLIIDEGFGSQDEEGLTHLMDAIYDIQDDFEKIIIVSHLPSMKSQFPTNFFVQKEADGSIVSVFEQG
ncbi:MAG: hypothetical protein UV38_C0001G0259 [candidate division TM6 bacterium GW2011_GWE2_42_60]|nr:MAG: hypothetical protein UV38_C0001G0259 [candidate division TM6 bacterium GW2011_GWE2_42_60]HBY05546.1 hypothetical protein [Candidatus Dependentiae bacterium]